MAGTCKSDAYQNSKNRNKFASKAIQKTWETHKTRKSKIVKHKLEIQANRAAKRLMQGKPQRGDARKARRAELQWIAEGVTRETL